jgi:hypothetical protein
MPLSHLEHFLIQSADIETTNFAAAEAAGRRAEVMASDYR